MPQTRRTTPGWASRIPFYVHKTRAHRETLPPRPHLAATPVSGYKKDADTTKEMRRKPAPTLLEGRRGGKGPGVIKNESIGKDSRRAALRCWCCVLPTKLEHCAKGFGGSSLGRRFCKLSPLSYSCSPLHLNQRLGCSRPQIGPSLQPNALPFRAGLLTAAPAGPEGLSRPHDDGEVAVCSISGDTDRRTQREQGRRGQDLRRRKRPSELVGRAASSTRPRPS